MAVGRPQIPKVRVSCFVCGKEVEKYPSQVAASRTGRFFCGVEHRNLAGKPRTVPPRECEWCGEQFVSYDKRPGGGRFCSKKHYDAWMRRNRVERTCEWCGEKFSVAPSFETRQAARFCCKAHANAARMKRPLDRMHNGKPAVLNRDGYVLVYEPDHPRANKGGWQFEHRLIVEKRIGRYLNSDEHVHHVNGQKDDNRPENLEVLAHSEHSVVTWNGRQAKLDAMQAELEQYRERYGALTEEVAQ